MTDFVVISMMILFGFLGVGMKMFGILGSYSAYSAKWGSRLPNRYISIWSLMTFLAALFMVPPMIEAGDGNPFQFLGFFAPLYLIVVSLTPDYEINKIQRRIHVIGAVVCALVAFLWIVIVCHRWFIVPLVAIVVALTALYVKRKDAYILWGELIMFGSVFITLFTLGL